VRVEAFRAFHIDLLIAQGVQGAQLGEISTVPRTYATFGPALSAFDGETILLCGGILQVHSQSGVLWALLSESAGAHMLALHKGTLRFLANHPLRRLEATVQQGFQMGPRWLKLLGFSPEGEMKAFGLNGETYLRFARIL